MGGAFSLWAQIQRNLQPAVLTATVAPFTKLMSAPDADADDLPDTSSAGLINPLSITEATLGSSTASGDSDGDGLGDCAEAMAGIAHGTDPLAQDTDRDGVLDPADMNPLCRMRDHIVRGSPTIDGLITVDEGWTLMTSAWGSFLQVCPRIG